MRWSHASEHVTCPLWRAAAARAAVHSAFWLGQVAFLADLFHILEVAFKACTRWCIAVRKALFNDIRKTKPFRCLQSLHGHFHVKRIFWGVLTNGTWTPNSFSPLWHQHVTAVHFEVLEGMANVSKVLTPVGKRYIEYGYKSLKKERHTGYMHECSYKTRSRIDYCSWRVRILCVCTAWYQPKYIHSCYWLLVSCRMISTAGLQTLPSASLRHDAASLTFSYTVTCSQKTAGLFFVGVLYLASKWFW